MTTMQIVEQGAHRLVLDVVSGVGLLVEPSADADLTMKAAPVAVTLSDGVTGYRPALSLHAASREAMLTRLRTLGYQLAEDHSECCGLPFGHPDRAACNWFDTPQMGTASDGGAVLEVHETGMVTPPSFEAWARSLADLADAVNVHLGPAE